MIAACQERFHSPSFVSNFSTLLARIVSRVSVHSFDTETFKAAVEHLP